MKLIHYSDQLSLNFKKLDQEEGDKPRGLWVSNDDCKYNWRWWCKANGFRSENLKYKHRIKLASTANVLYLKTAEEIDDFSNAYGDSLRTKEQFGCTARKDKIDWPLISTLYDGIIIAPYQWECRLSRHTFWYYGWDCASGCIWNEAAIEGIELIQTKRTYRIPSEKKLLNRGINV